MKSSFGWADLRCFIFAVFRRSDSLHEVVRQSKNQKRILSLAYNFAQPVRRTKDSKGITNPPI
ncbi:MAG: hypothetical protein ACI4HI_15295, partial [Lachnospiraceae bacterium]